jgi:hypothetical protein
VAAASGVRRASSTGQTRRLRRACWPDVTITGAEANKTPVNLTQVSSAGAVDACRRPIRPRGRWASAAAASCSRSVVRPIRPRTFPTASASGRCCQARPAAGVRGGSARQTRHRKAGTHLQLPPPFFFCPPPPFPSHWMLPPGPTDPSGHG